MAVKNEYLALGTIALAGLGASLASGGGDKAAPQTTPAPVESIKADSAEETDFIRQFVAEAEKEEKAH